MLIKLTTDGRTGMKMRKERAKEREKIKRPGKSVPNHPSCHSGLAKEVEVPSFLTLCLASFQSSCVRRRRAPSFMDSCAPSQAEKEARHNLSGQRD